MDVCDLSTTGTMVSDNIAALSNIKCTIWFSIDKGDSRQIILLLNVQCAIIVHTNNPRQLQIAFVVVVFV